MPAIIMRVTRNSERKTCKMKNIKNQENSVKIQQIYLKKIIMYSIMILIEPLRAMNALCVYPLRGRFFMWGAR